MYFHGKRLSSSSDWTHPPEYLAILPGIRLLILGPYRKGGLRKLKRIKAALIRKGILNTKLVIDFHTPIAIPNEKDYDLRKSIYWIKQADLLLFVFFGGLDAGGTAIELKNAIDSRRSSICIVAYYESESQPISLIIKQLVSRFDYDITQISFRTTMELINKVYGHIISRLAGLYETICDRPPEEWDLTY